MGEVVDVHILQSCGNLSGNYGCLGLSKECFLINVALKITVRHEFHSDVQVVRIFKPAKELDEEVSVLN